MFESIMAADGGLRRAGPSSLEVASRCGVNSKTIRDIWNRETWVRATRSLWTEEEEEAYREALRSKGELPAGGGDAGGGGGAEGGSAPRGEEGDESQVRVAEDVWWRAVTAS